MIMPEWETNTGKPVLLPYWYDTTTGIDGRSFFPIPAIQKAEEKVRG